MKTSKEFRALARDALSGKWVMAIITGLVASILGAQGGLPEINFDLNVTEQTTETTTTYFDALSPSIQTLYSSFAKGAFAIFILGLVVSILLLVIGSVINVGYTKYNLDLVDHKEASIETLFAYFKNWKNIVITLISMHAIVIIGLIFLIIPGLIMMYTYALTPYILAENPELKPREALAKSKELMTGNKSRLFLLSLSFIGWTIVCMLTFGIGNLVLRPYQEAAFAAFYREVSATEYMSYNIEY